MDVDRSSKAARGRTRIKLGEVTDKPTPTLPAEGQREPFHERALLAAIVDSSDDAIVSKTLEGRILSWNRGATRIFGWEPHEVIGQPITIIIPPELHAEERQILEKLRHGERIEHFDTVRVAKDGRRLAISLTVSPVRSPDGTVIGASKIARDVSERKLAEERLRASQEALQLADRRKDEFLALLAHELRNPLAPIRYALAANKKPGRTPEQCRLADDIIERQVAHMSRLLDDLLDISRITRGTLELKKTRAELTSVVGAAIETARPILDEKHHTLALDLPAQPLQLEADVVRLAQVFSNLLINAAKYTDPGGQIRLRASPQGNDVIVSVSDNGIGIPAELLPRVFHMFFQSHAALGRAEGGLGVGLSLVRGLVRLHGGSVEARSEGPGRGAEFEVRLPVAERRTARRGRTRAAAERSDDSRRVLVVEDNPDAAESLAMLLRMLGHQVRTVHDAHAALDAVKAEPPDVALVDIGLPGMDGYELALRLRELEIGTKTYLVALTGYGLAQDKRRAAEAGFHAHVVKPIGLEQLKRVLNRTRA